MLNRTSVLFLFLFLIFPQLGFSVIRVAITVDDLPFHSPLPESKTRIDLTQDFLDSFHKHQISGVYGFINATVNQEDKKAELVLKNWVRAGHFLGNHTFSHMPLYAHTPHDYVADIRKNDPTLEKWMEKKDFRWFRYPYLAEGDTEQKRNDVRAYLSQQNYKIAQVTSDFSD